MTTETNIREAYETAPKDLEILGDAIYPGEEKSETLQEKITYAWYYAISKVLQPEVITEFGVRYGYSAIALIKGCTEKPDFYGCDNECYGELGMSARGSNDYAHKHISPLTAECDIQKGDTSTALLMPSDIIHVDAGHSYDEALKDLEKVKPFAKYILVDDVNNRELPGVKKACDDFCAKHSLSFFDLPTYRGLRFIDCRS